MGKNHANVDPYVVSRVRALESLLLERGVLAPDAVDKVVRRYGEATGPLLGARAVARAWRDPGYKRLLLEDSKAALAALGARLRPPGRGREHAGRPQPGRLHALLLLPVGRARPPADVVQAAGLPLAGGVRASPGAPRSSALEIAGRPRRPRVGLERGGPLHGAAPAAGRARRGSTRPSWSVSFPGTR